MWGFLANTLGNIKSLQILSVTTSKQTIYYCLLQTMYGQEPLRHANKRSKDLGALLDNSSENTCKFCTDVT